MSDSEPATEPATTLTVDIEVRYAETDQMGVVHHSRYLPWFEIARTRLCQRVGYHYAEIEEMGYRLVVTGVELTYRQGARYGQIVEVDCHLAKLSSRGLEFAYRVRHGDRRLAEGLTRHVWVEAATGRPCRIPALLEEPFSKLLACSLGG